ncbi:GNAT family N-acetyltransferase [Pseudonocardia sp. TRM90224]|uniref:GNAT family N-acetyltransferase n=1 Tax=Pseudonocardia sp. TRM90224 TaxID=2812678 RepID=UPI001E61540D|nr:GNAT family protein [Pseudonocardia sp. TRM90224]
MLETPRLMLREIVPADAHSLFAFRSDVEEQKHNDPPHKAVSESYELIARLAAEYRETGAVRWGLTIKGYDDVVGLLGFNFWAREHHRAGIGYDLSRHLWGQGLMFEAMTAALEHGFTTMGLNRVEAHTNSDNLASRRMLQRLGFWQEGTFHDHFFEDGAYHDVALYVMLRRDRPEPRVP